MRERLLKTSKFLLTTLCALLIIAHVAILTPEVEAASETKETETKQTDSSIYISDTEDKLALNRAITIDEAKKEAQNTVKELTLSSAEEETQAQTFEELPPAQVETSIEETVSSSSTSSAQQGTSYVSGTNASGYLMDIENPDPNYTSYSVVLSDADRDLAERIVMGEAGSCGYTGMALVAQCLRDTFVKGGYSNITDVIAQNGYYGSTSIKPSSTCKEVVNYIFDQGGAAVQHRIIVYYASNYCSSSWHESQNYICSYGYVRFFDTWY